METNSILTLSCLSTLEQYIESQTQKVRFHGASLHLSSVPAETNACNIDRIGLLKEYLQLSYHACACRWPYCTLRRCSRMKSLVEHYKSCDFTFHCQYYRSFYCLVVIHARECKELEHCRVPTCKSIRLSLQEKYIKQVIDNNLFLLNYDKFFEKWSQGSQTSRGEEQLTVAKRKYDAIEATDVENALQQTPKSCGDLYEVDTELNKSRQEMMTKRSNLILKLKKWHEDHPVTAATSVDSRNLRLKLFPSVKAQVFETIFDKLSLNHQKLLKELFFAKLTVRIMRKEQEINRRASSLTEYANLMSEFIYENQKRMRSLKKPVTPTKVLVDATSQTEPEEAGQEQQCSSKRLKLQ